MAHEQDPEASTHTQQDEPILRCGMVWVLDDESLFVQNAVWASSNETRCLRRLSAALRGSQSKCSSATDYIVATDRVACNSSHPVVLKGGCGAPVKVGSCIRLLACPGPPACPPMLRLACRRVSRMSSRRRRASGRCYRAPQDSVPSRAQGLPRTHPTLPPDRPSV